MKTNLYLRKKKIPLIFLFLGALIAVTLSASFIISTPVIQSRASDNQLKRLELLNVSPTQVVVFWETPDLSISWIQYGQGKSIKRVVQDELNLHGERKKIHFATIQNLQEETKYGFYIYTHSAQYGSAGNVPFTFKTPKKAVVRQQVQPIFGEVHLKNTLPLEGAVVLVRISNMSPFGAITKSKGEFLIPFSYVYSLPEWNSVMLKNEDIMNVSVYSEKGSGELLARISQGSSISQPLTIGEHLDITKSEAVLSVSTKTNEEQNMDVFQTSTDVILFPREGAYIPSYKPLFKGTAPQGSEISMEVQGKKLISFRVKADEKGSWKVIPDIPLDPGPYSMTVIIKAVDGSVKKYVRLFSVAKSGEQVLGNATTSPTIVVPTTQPISPTIIPSITSSISQTITSTPPKTGMNPSFIIAIASGFIIVGVGLLMLF